MLWGCLWGRGGVGGRNRLHHAQLVLIEGKNKHISTQKSQPKQVYSCPIYASEKLGTSAYYHMFSISLLQAEKKEEGKQGASTKKRASAAQLRITKVIFKPLALVWQNKFCTLQDLNELELPKTCKTEFPDIDDLLNFKLIIYPDEVFLYIWCLVIRWYKL